MMKKNHNNKVEIKIKSLVAYIENKKIKYRRKQEINVYKEKKLHKKIEN